MSERVLPDGWREVTLGQLVAEAGGSIQTGPFGSALHAADYVLNGVPTVMPANIGDNVINDEGIARISADDHERLKGYQLRAGDIVYSRRGDVERRSLVRKENDGWLCGTGCLRVRFNDAEVVDSAFLSYALGTDEARAWIVRHAIGATMLNLNTSILGNVPLVAPPVGDQRAIAEVLGALDDKIAANKRGAAAALTLAACEYRSLTMHAPWGRLSDLIRLDYGKALPLATREAGVVPVYGSGGIVGTHSTALARGPAIVLGRKGTVGAVYWSDGPCFAIDTTYLASPIGGHSAEFAFYALQAAPLAETNVDSAVPGLNRREAYAVPTRIPGEADEATFSRRASLLRTRSLAAEQENLRLAATRDALLPALMSGRLTVRDAERVVADAT